MSRLVKFGFIIFFSTIGINSNLYAKAENSKILCATSKKLPTYAIAYELSDIKKLEDNSRMVFKKIIPDDIQDCRLLNQKNSDYIAYVIRGKKFYTKVETSFGGMTIVSIRRAVLTDEHDKSLNISVYREEDGVELVGNAVLGKKSQLVSFKYKNKMSDKDYHKKRKEISHEDFSSIKEISGETIYVIVGDNFGYYHAIYYRFDYKEGYHDQE